MGEQILFFKKFQYLNAGGENFMFQKVSIPQWLRSKFIFLERKKEKRKEKMTKYKNQYLKSS